MPARSSAALMANPPNSDAENDASAPDSLPMGVRAPETMTEPGMPPGYAGLPVGSQSSVEDDDAAHGVAHGLLRVLGGLPDGEEGELQLFARLDEAAAELLVLPDGVGETSDLALDGGDGAVAAGLLGGGLDARHAIVGGGDDLGGALLGL